jgi:hypothetical protein
LLHYKSILLLFKIYFFYTLFVYFFTSFVYFYCKCIKKARQNTHKYFFCIKNTSFVEKKAKKNRQARQSFLKVLAFSKEQLKNAGYALYNIGKKNANKSTSNSPIRVAQSSQREVQVRL